jgi:hypothetical protein
MSHSFSTILKTLGVPTLVARASALGVFLLEVGVNPMDRLDPNGGVVLLARKRVGEVGVPKLHAIIFYGEPNVDVVDVLLRLRPSSCLLEYYIQGILSAHLVLLTAVAVGHSRPIPLRDSSRLFWYHSLNLFLCKFDRL